MGLNNNYQMNLILMQI